MTDLKSKLFSTEAYRGPKTTVEVEGIEVEIRTPTLAQLEENAQATKNGRLTGGESGLRVLIGCVFDPETGDPVFDEHDLERLMEGAAHSGGMVAQLLKGLNDLVEDSDSIRDDVKN